MNDPQRTWQRLVRAARRDETALPEIPPGFATRVVAQARAEQATLPGWSPSLIWRSIAIAACIAAVFTTVQFRALTGQVEAELASLHGTEVEADSGEVS